ncbi:hypothetical protein PCASD_12834 [Puccinia coronata f. sp. avenae]|uniref:Uncharacterized protein n=1 Tax=Puccinia coronata f. sp. avenae TaxID=200324 RepID=A0A2N5TAZ0_9BASI|nr:hypothetical protein PCASD_12834 [Puccinia coronata f. sp. avenae]
MAQSSCASASPSFSPPIPAAANSDLEISSESHQPLARSQRPSKSTAAPSSSTQVEPEVTSHRNTTSRAKKRKRTTVEDLDPNVAVMDLTQDSDPNNKEAKKLEVWASKIHQAQSYITSHRNGNLAQSACPGQSAAIKAGANLPITLKEQQAKETQAASSAMSNFV